MQEIGAPAHSCHLCCVPRPATSGSAQRSPSRSASSSRSPVGSTSNASQRRAHAKTGTAKPVPPSPAGERSAWFSLVGAGSSGRKVSRFPVGELVKTGALSCLFKTEAASMLDTNTCLSDLPDFRSPPPSPASARESLRTLLGYEVDGPSDPGQVSEGSEGMSDEHVEAYGDATHDDVAITSQTEDVDTNARPLSRSASFDSLTTATSSEAPVTPRSHSPPLSDLTPALADLEHNSRFRVQAVCITCKKTGTNFPSCGHCGERWCSRDCRIKGGVGRRHLCTSRERSPQEVL